MSKRKTVVELFEEILSAYPLSDEHKEFLTKRKEQTERKNASGSKAERKPTATQLENAGIKEDILALLEQEGRAMNATEVGKALGIDSNHKVSALLTQLRNADKVIRTEVKGRAMFSIAKTSAED